MENVDTEEIIQVINDYIKSNYDYDYADVFDDSITVHLRNNKLVYIGLTVEHDEEEDLC